MRKTLLILSLAGLTVFAGASNAFAQFRLFGGGWGYSPGISIGVGGGGYYSPYGYYGGRGYRSYYRGYGNAYQLAPSYYNIAPNYSVVPATYYDDVQPQVRPSYYPAPEIAQGSASMTVLVPAADAQVWFDGAATKQQGMERLFHSPTLAPNRTFRYTIKARWVENGQAVNQERQINVQAGQSITVNFRERLNESVPPPLPRLPNPIPSK